MKKLTQMDMLREVKESPVMFEAYCQELTNRQIRWSNKGCTIGKKRVGIQEFNNAQKRAAAAVYEVYSNLPL